MVLDELQVLELQEIIDQALKKLYHDDLDLIKRGGMERSVSFRFALYVYELILESEWLRRYNLDLEYNKNGVKPKRLPTRPKGAQPDIILHRRGSNEENILVIEIKGWWNDYPRKDDYDKIVDFIHQEGEYKYGLGVLLELEVGGCAPKYLPEYVFTDDSV
jgi:hypothetical protein